jgi:hypothetical protein
MLTYSETIVGSLNLRLNLDPPERSKLEGTVWIPASWILRASAAGRVDWVAVIKSIGGVGATHRAAGVEDVKQAISGR